MAFGNVEKRDDEREFNLDFQDKAAAAAAGPDRYDIHDCQIVNVEPRRLLHRVVDHRTAHR